MQTGSMLHFDWRWAMEWKEKREESVWILLSIHHLSNFKNGWPPSVQKSLLETLDHLCSFSYWISRLAKSQMRSTKGPTLYNCRESFFSVWKKEMERGKKKSSFQKLCAAVAKKILSRRAVGDCNWLRNLCVNEESLAREIDFDTRLGTKRESQEGAKSKDSSYLKKQRGFFVSPTNI